MAQIDRTKEELGYFKFWLGILCVGAFGVIGWVFTHIENASVWLLSMAIAGLIFLFFGSIFCIKKINILLNRIEKE